MADIDDLSNGALDAIEARRYDEAEKLCRRLLSEYPDAPDGHDRSGALREAQGRFQEAADHYTQVVGIIKKNLEDFGEEGLQYFVGKRDQMQAKAKTKA
jgi:tetratricopeptide (TPR) repeat protein